MIGQVGELLDGGDDIQIERIPRVFHERPDSPFAQDHLRVPAGQDILGTHEEFIEGR